MRESMVDSTDGSLYHTEVFVGADDERLLAEFERAIKDELNFEDSKNSKLPDPVVHGITESSKSKFKAIKYADVEMNSTGQEMMKLLISLAVSYKKLFPILVDEVVIHLYFGSNT